MVYLCVFSQFSLHALFPGRCHITKYLLDPRTKNWNEKIQVFILQCFCLSKHLPNITTNQNLHGFELFWQAEESPVLTISSNLPCTAVNWRYRGQLQSQLLWYPQSATPMGVSMVPKQGYMPHYACFHSQLVQKGIFFFRKSTQSDGQMVHWPRKLVGTLQQCLRMLLKHLIWPRRVHWGVRWPSGQKREAGSVGQRGERPEFGKVFFSCSLNFPRSQAWV